MSNECFCWCGKKSITKKQPPTPNNYPFKKNHAISSHLIPPRPQEPELSEYHHIPHTQGLAMNLRSCLQESGRFFDCRAGAFQFGCQIINPVTRCQFNIAKGVFQDGTLTIEGAGRGVISYGRSNLMLKCCWCNFEDFPSKSASGLGWSQM